DYALVGGIPARQLGWVSRDGEVLGEDLVCPRTGEHYQLLDGRLHPVADNGRSSPADPAPIEHPTDSAADAEPTPVGPATGPDPVAVVEPEVATAANGDASDDHAAPEPQPSDHLLGSER
ncbi:MAG: hypothetical protein AAF531_19440, partial [Actinomycetota bacterium]